MIPRRHAQIRQKGRGMDHIQLPKCYSLDALPTSTLSRLEKLGGVFVFEALDHALANYIMSCVIRKPLTYKRCKIKGWNEFSTGCRTERSENKSLAVPADVTDYEQVNRFNASLTS
jgi:hypothetical protein